MLDFKQKLYDTSISRTQFRRRMQLDAGTVTLHEVAGAVLVGYSHCLWYECTLEITVEIVKATQLASQQLTLILPAQCEDIKPSTDQIKTTSLRLRRSKFP